MQGWTATTRLGVTRKRNTERLRHTGNLFRKNLQLKDGFLIDYKDIIKDCVLQKVQFWGSPK